MAPRDIFIVRHGERWDKKVPGWGASAARPHDPALTANGVAMAEALGAYLRTHYRLTPSDVVVLSSPLWRCAMTAAGIVSGLLGEPSRSGADADDVDNSAKKETSSHETRLPPIYVEKSLVESAKWQLHDMMANPNVAKPQFCNPPSPLFRGTQEMHEVISPHIQLECLHLLAKEPSSPLMYVKNGELVEDDFEGRCGRAAKALSASNDPVLQDKVVVCVTHGEVSGMWCDLIAGGARREDAGENPAYTAFVHLIHGAGHTEESPRWTLEEPRFTTPHLAEKPAEY